MKMKFLKTEIQVGGKIALETKQQQKCSAKKLLAGNSKTRNKLCWDG